jgi:hypothetical protein
MTKIIKFDAYKNKKKAQARHAATQRIRRGYDFADQAVIIIEEEAAKNPYIDNLAVWYGVVRYGIMKLQDGGWTDSDLQKLLEDSK